MPSQYDDAGPHGCPRQGEILCNLVEVRPVPPLASNKIVHRPHPYAIVVSADCDIEWDFKARFGHDIADPESKKLFVILLCELHTAQNLRDNRGLTADLWRRLPRNQDERYHWLDGAEIPVPALGLPALVADFKQVLALPPDVLYDQLGSASAARLAVLASPFLYQFLHRFYTFHSRIAVPD